MSIVCLPGRVEKSEGALTMEEWVQLGRAAARGKKSVAVALFPGVTDRASLHALSAGILSTGAQLRYLGSCLVPEFRCCAIESGAELSLMVNSPSGGLVLSHSGEDASFPLSSGGDQVSYGREVSMEQLKELYPIFLLRAAVAPLEMIPVAVLCSSIAVRTLVAGVFSQLGVVEGKGGFQLRLSSAGEVLSVAQKGAVLRGSELQRMVHGSGRGKRLLEQDGLFRLDSLMQAIFLISYLREKGISLLEWKRQCRPSRRVEQMSDLTEMQFRGTI